MAYYNSESEVRSFTPLTMGEEQKLFQKFYSRHSGSRAARDKIILHHLALVARIACQARYGRVEMEDAISMANEKLMKVLEKEQFHPKFSVHGERRPTRFCKFLECVIHNYIRNKCRQDQAFRQRNRENPDVESGNFTPAEKNYPSRLPLYEEVTHGYKPVIRNIADSRSLIWPEIVQRDLKAERLKIWPVAMKQLSPLEQELVQRITLKGQTIRDTAKALKRRRQWTYTAHRKALAKLRKFFNKHYPELKP